MTVRSTTQDAAIGELVRTYRDSKAPTANYIFLFGAGTSFSCGIPLAAAMVSEQLQFLRASGRITPASVPPDGQRDYQWVMSQFDAVEQADIIRRYIELGKTRRGLWKRNPCYVVLTEIWKRYPQSHRCLLTTNFDPLLHYALLMEGLDAKLIRYFRELEYMSPFQTTTFPSIIHLHGYWQNHHLYNCLADFEEYSDRWARELARHLIEHNVGIVVLGYSGYPKDVFMRTLTRICQELGTRLAGKVFWCRLANERMNNATYAVLDSIPDVYELPIHGADSFMLDLGAALGNLPVVERMSAFGRILGVDKAGYVTEYGNNAKADVHVLRQAPDPDEVIISIQTHPDYGRPGDNNAGIAVRVTNGELDLTRYSAVTVEYDADLLGQDDTHENSLEFKLQSAWVGHIENIPLGKSQKVTIPLSKYSADGVDLANVEQIVVGADCIEIGRGSRLEVKLRRITWS